VNFPGPGKSEVYTRLRPEIDMKSEMRSCLLFGITEAAAAKAVNLATKCNMS
jgi:hypothetical protein